MYFQIKMKSLEVGIQPILFNLSFLSLLSRTWQRLTLGSCRYLSSAITFSQGSSAPVLWKIFLCSSLLSSSLLLYLPLLPPFKLCFFKIRNSTSDCHLAFYCWQPSCLQSSNNFLHIC